MKEPKYYYCPHCKDGYLEEIDMLRCSISHLKNKCHRRNMLIKSKDARIKELKQIVTGYANKLLTARDRIKELRTQVERLGRAKDIEV